MGRLVSQLSSYTLAPKEEERASEAAGVNSAGGNFGDTQLKVLIADEPPAVQAEVIAINDQARALSLEGLDFGRFQRGAAAADVGQFA